MTERDKLLEALRGVGLLKKGGSIDYDQISEITGLKKDSLKVMLQPKESIPRWCKLIVYIWEKETPVTEEEYLKAIIIAERYKKQKEKI